MSASFGQVGTPLVSVVVPTYNGERYLRHTLDSLAAQTYEALEVIVVDDGSTDDSRGIARSHACEPRVVAQQNKGVAVARNRGMAVASGEWIAFLDQDDLWHRDRLATLIDLATRTGSGAVATTETPFAYGSQKAELENVGDGRDAWVRWIEAGSEGELTAAPVPGASRDVESIPLERLLQGAAMITTSAMYRRELAISAGGCAPHARALDDHMLNLNVARLIGAIPRIDSGELFYRVHAGSTTTVSPMVGPFLSSQGAVRLGGVFPREHYTGPNLEHLLFGVAASDLAISEKLALIVLNTPRKGRARWIMRWVARELGIR